MPDGSWKISFPDNKEKIMTVIGVSIVLAGLGLGVLRTAGAIPVFLDKFASIFRLTFLQLSLLIALAGGLVLVADLVITYYRFHPVNFHKNKDKPKDAEE